MDQFKIITKSEAETQDIAKKLAVLLDAGSIITLEGSLGVGKTSFVKGLAKGLRITDPITSPTFTIIKEYQGEQYPLYHIDAYRLEYSEEDIGFDEYFYSDGISVVEWAQFIKSDLPEQFLQINLIYVNEHSRKLQFHPLGEKYLSIVKTLFEGLDEEFIV